MTPVARARVLRARRRHAPHSFILRLLIYLFICLLYIHHAHTHTSPKDPIHSRASHPKKAHPHRAYTNAKSAPRSRRAPRPIDVDRRSGGVKPHPYSYNHTHTPIKAMKITHARHPVLPSLRPHIWVQNTIHYDPWASKHNVWRSAATTRDEAQKKKRNMRTRMPSIARARARRHSPHVTASEVSRRKSSFFTSHPTSR